MINRLFRAYRRPLMLALAALLGLLLVLCSPGISHPLEDGPSQLQQGRVEYEAARFAPAIAHWQAALAAFTQQQNSLYQALAWSNLSLAYQQLGQWQSAEAAIATSLALLASEPSEPAENQNASTARNILAKALNTQGRLHWSRGQMAAAQESWRQAAIAYQQAGDDAGVVLALINEANALQALGFSVQAAAQLQRVYQLVQQQPDAQVRVVGLRSLGVALRRVGQLSASQTRLRESLQAINDANLDGAKSALFLELGNTEWALWQRAIALGKMDDAQTYQEATLAFYQQAVSAATLPLEHLQAQLNQLKLLTQTGQTTAATELATALLADFPDLPASRTTVEAHLNFARTVRQLPAFPQTQTAQVLTTALQLARELRDPITESRALGQLGELYEQTGQWQAAQRLTEQALLKAEGTQASDGRYQWEWQLGRLQRQQGDRAGAIASYQAAIASLQSVRSDLLTIDADIQFAFRDGVEPIYREFVELLLSDGDGSPPSQAVLKQAIQQVDALQLAELENFLRCDIGAVVALDEVEADPTAAKLYPLLLANRLAVVLDIPHQPLVYHEVSQSRPQVEAQLHQLRRDLGEPDRTPEAIAQLTAVYQWLIQPFEATLADHPQIQTLVFVLDGALRNVPMAALYDGERYLVERYGVAVAPRLTLFQPEERSPRLSVFLGGVGEPQTLNNQTFPKIENLTPELNTIQELANAAPPLIDAAFTKTRLEQQLNSGTYSAIHLKTHGVFSSDPEETFILAYGEVITSRELGHLLQSSRSAAPLPLELLVLSACSTAQGDNRAVLGMAGIAIQAGARSVVSTLWEAQDLPNTQLMIRFYQELLNPNTSRAQALRLAQLSLLQQGYTRPHIWATYVLVGNWR
ncbi:MAG: CHAT domain-containing protein [Synechococcales bacterium]|nr:CHAT domain-containing protein [Synechococcales bacterium]